jgi:hypothetical protein
MQLQQEKRCCCGVGYRYPALIYVSRRKKCVIMIIIMIIIFIITNAPSGLSELHWVMRSA